MKGLAHQTGATPRRLILSLMLTALLGYLLIFLLASWQARHSVLNRVMVRDDSEAQAVFTEIQKFVSQQGLSHLALSPHDVRQLDRILKVATYGRRIARINIVGPGLEPVYASDQRDLSKVRFDDREKLDQALQGKSFSALHAELTGQEQEIEFYAPIRNINGEIIGAAEVYFALSHVLTEFNMAARKLFWLILAFLVIFSGLLYAYFEMLIGRIDRGELERKRHEQRARSLQSLANAGVMISGLAHQLRNPVSVLKGLSRALRKRIEGGDGLQYVEALEQETGRISSLIESFLHFAKPINGAADGQRCELSSLLQIVAATLLEKRPNLMWQVSGDPQLVLKASATLVRELLLNIGNNALESVAVGAAPHISVEVGKRQAKAHIVIRDNGPGWPSEMLGDESSAFQPFYTTKANGSGLGLAMCRRIVDALEGTIQLRNAPSGGAEVEIELPLAD